MPSTVAIASGLTPSVSRRTAVPLAAVIELLHVIRLSWPQIADEADRVAVLLAARLQETVQAGALTTSPSKASKARSSEAEMQVKIGVSFSV